MRGVLWESLVINTERVRKPTRGQESQRPISTLGDLRSVESGALVLRVRSFSQLMRATIMWHEKQQDNASPRSAATTVQRKGRNGLWITSLLS